MKKLQVELTPKDGYIDKWEQPRALREQRVLSDIYIELNAATAKFGKFNSHHEGWAVLREEVDELWDAIKENGTVDEIRAEAVQVGAMAMRLILDCCKVKEDEEVS